MAGEGGDVRHCRIELELGMTKACPGERCAFWREGERPEADGCVFERVDLAGRADLARWLHELRERLERP